MNADKLGGEARADAEETGIAFGWEVASLLVGPAVCIAACEYCEGLSARAELPRLPDEPEVRRAVQLQQEGRVWDVFKRQALFACCDHLLDYLAHKGTFVLPTERAKDYAQELLRQEDRDACGESGIVFGFTRHMGFIVACDRCEFVLRWPPENVVEDEAVAAHVAIANAIPYAVKKTCAHFFRWLELRRENLEQEQEQEKEGDL